MKVEPAGAAYRLTLVVLVLCSLDCGIARSEESDVAGDERAQLGQDVALSRVDADSLSPILPGKTASFALPLPRTYKVGDDVRLRFRIRVDNRKAAGLGGWSDSLGIRVNGSPLSLWTADLRCRLRNKPVMIWPQDPQLLERYLDRMYATGTSWAIFIASNFSAAKTNDPYLPLIGDPFTYVLDVTDLIQEGSLTEIAISNTGDSSNVIVEGCQIEALERPKATVAWRKEGPLPLKSSRDRTLACPLDFSTSESLTNDAIAQRASQFPLIIDNFDKTMMSHDTQYLPDIGQRFHKANPECQLIRYYCPTLPFWVHRKQAINQHEEMFEHLFPNWGFEDGDSGWELTNARIVEGVAHNGSRAAEIRIENKNGEGWLLSQPISISEDRGIKLTAWMKLQDVQGPGANLFVRFYSDTDATKPIGTAVEGAPLTGTSNWTIHHLGEWSQEYHSKPFTKSPQGTKAMRMGLRLKGRGTVWFDDTGRVHQLDYQPSARGLSNVAWFNTMPDWRSPEFQTFISREFAEILKGGDFDGIFLDQLFPAIYPWNVTAMPYDYTITAHQADAIAMLKDVTAQFDTQGKLLIINSTSMSGPWPYYVYLPYAHGILSEQYFARPAPTEDDAFPPEDSWKMQLSSIYQGQLAFPNRVFIPLSFLDFDDYRLRTFVLASYLLIRGDYCYLGTHARTPDKYHGDPGSPNHTIPRLVQWLHTYRSEFDVDLGAPLGPLEPVPDTDFHVYTRRFENGVVFACAGGEGPYQIPLNRPAQQMAIHDATLKDPAGRLTWTDVESLAISPRSAYIIRYSK